MHKVSGVYIFGNYLSLPKNYCASNCIYTTMNSDIFTLIHYIILLYGTQSFLIIKIKY